MDMKELLAKIAPAHPEPILKAQDTALLLIDMQKMSGIDRAVYKAGKLGIPESVVRETLADMDLRFKEATKNAARILEIFRKNKMTIAHTKIEALTLDCRDVGKNHHLHGHIIPPGSEWGQFYDAVIPKEGEIVMSKTCSSFFTGTHIDRVLRYTGVENVIVVGFVTEQCVSTTARDACDHGYYVYVVSDACATSTVEKHEYELSSISNIYAKILTTQEIISRLETL